MLTTSAGAPPGLESFSDQDRLLIRKSEEAIRDGFQLAQWYVEREGNLPMFPLNLKRTFRLPNRPEGFFGFVEIGGERRSVMGCRQDIDFGRIEGANAPDRLREFVLGEFLKRAHWSYEDGSPGGFIIEKSLYKAAQGEYGKFPAGSQQGCIDFRQLGTLYDWVLLTVYICDFVMQFGPVRKRLEEAVCFAAHADFVRAVENPSQEYTLEVSVGYPVVDFAPIPNYFGFGPGNFRAAFQLFSFFLRPNNEVRARLVFAAAPRCQKVFDFGKHIPDPVYGGAKLIHYLTLGLWDPQTFHARLDAGMLAQHCRVHQTLMEGVEKIWNDWMSGGVS